MSIRWQGRDALNKIKPYSPGKAIAEVKEELGLETVYKMASNENPLGPSPQALNAIRESLEGIHIYPDGSSLALKKAIAGKLALSPEEVIIGNGSDEIIKLAGESFLSPGDVIMMGDPSFSEYDYAGNLMDAEVRKIPLKNHGFDLQAMAAAIDSKVKIIALCNPNNPTGTVLEEDKLRAFIRQVPEDVIVILDEAYKEYAGEGFFSGVAFVREGYKNILVLNTFSKIYGLAALRVGYGLGSKELISWILRAKEPFNVNLLAQKGAEAALEDKGHVQASLDLNEEGKAYLYKEFKARGFNSTLTGGNFIWTDIGADSLRVFDGLLRKGVVIRPGAVFGAPTHIRVTIDRMEVNRHFIQMLDEVLREMGREAEQGSWR